MNEEFDPDMHLMLQMYDGREIRMDRSNSALFTFLGRNAMGEDLSLRNHVFVHYQQDEKDRYSYIFRRSPVFEDLQEFMLEYDFPQHLNLPELAECDEEAYQMMIDKEVDDQQFDLPDNWLDS